MSSPTCAGTNNVASCTGNGTVCGNTCCAAGQACCNGVCCASGQCCNNNVCGACSVCSAGGDFCGTFTACPNTAGACACVTRANGDPVCVNAGGKANDNSCDAATESNCGPGNVCITSCGNNYCFALCAGG